MTSEIREKELLPSDAVEEPLEVAETKVPWETSDLVELAHQLREIDERHGRKTERSIEEYAEIFETNPAELIKGKTLNIGDPFVRLAGDFPNVVTLDYFYGHDVRDDIRQLAAKPERTAREEEWLSLLRRWNKRTTERLRQGALAVRGVFPALPFRDASFDRVLSLNAISMHPFDEKLFTPEEWHAWWGEIVRVLKEDGKAFIGPFTTLSEHETWVMRRVLDELVEQGNIGHFIIGETKQNKKAPFIGPSYVVIEKTSK